MKYPYILLLFLPLFGWSQNYLPMLDHNSEWHVTSCFSGCITDVYYTDGDTVFNGQTYTVLNGYHFISRTFWLREDIPEQKVFMSIKEPNKAREEFLVYDFSMEVGDSIDIKNPISPFPTSPGYFVVDSILNVQLTDGQIYRQFHLSPTPSTTSSELPVWIESIGSLSLINGPGGSADIGGEGKLSCHINDGQVVYTQLDSISNCLAVYVADLTENGQFEVNLYPNPFEHKLFFRAPSLMKKISLYDVGGNQLSISDEINALDTYLDLRNLATGVYFARLNSSWEVYFTKK